MSDAWKHSDNVNSCHQINLFIGPCFVAVPYMWRLLQSVRHAVKRSHHDQWVNAGKYISALILIAFNSLYAEVKDNTYPWFATLYLVLWIAFMCFAVLYFFLWDITMDWGLFLWTENIATRAVSRHSTPRSREASQKSPLGARVSRNSPQVQERDSFLHSVEDEASGSNVTQSLKEIFALTYRSESEEPRSPMPQAPVSAYLDPATPLRSQVRSKRSSSLETMSKVRRFFVFRKDPRFSMWYYVLSCIFNFIGRVFWTAMLSYNLFASGRDFVRTGLCVIEILRRANWSILRLEYAQVSNHLHYRLARFFFSISLPIYNNCGLIPTERTCLFQEYKRKCHKNIRFLDSGALFIIVSSSHHVLYSPFF